MGQSFNNSSSSSRNTDCVPKKWYMRQLYLKKKYPFVKKKKKNEGALELTRKIFRRDHRDHHVIMVNVESAL